MGLNLSPLKTKRFVLVLNVKRRQGLIDFYYYECANAFAGD